MSADAAPAPSFFDLMGGHYMSPVEDPWSVYRRLRDESPVLLVEVPFGEQYLITRYDDCVTVLRDAQTFSSAINGRGVGMVMGRTILEMDGKDHGRHRALISPFFVPKAMDATMESEIRAVADALVDRLEKRGKADLVREFTLTFPLRIIARIIGIPIDDYEQFQQWALDIIALGDDPVKGMESAQALVGHLRPILTRRRAEPSDDLISRLAHAEVDGERLEDEEIFSFLRLLVPAGAETTYRLLGNTLFGLLTNPRELDRLREAPEDIPWALEEALRWESAVGMAARNTTVDVELGGVRIPEGAALLVSIASAGRDERHYDDPERFDVGRHADDHLAFGYGRHFCAGSHLAKLEAEVAIRAMLERLPNLRLDPDSDAKVVGLAFRSPNRLPVRFG